MRSLDVFRFARNRWTSHHVTPDVSASRASSSLTHTFPVSVSRDCYDMCMSHGDPPRLFLCHVYVFSLMPLTHLRWWWLVLAGLRYAHMSSERFVCRFFLCPVFYPTTLPCLHLPDWTLFPSCPFTNSTPVCTCTVLTCIYTGLEMGRSPSSIYFATTLKLWLERSHILSLDRSSSLAKATALLVLGISPLSTRLPVVKCSLRSVLRCARNNFSQLFVDYSLLVDHSLLSTFFFDFFWPFFFDYSGFCLGHKQGMRLAMQLGYYAHHKTIKWVCSLQWSETKVWFKCQISQKQSTIR